MINDLLRETEGRMNKAIEALEEEFRGLRTGRATPALIERVMVDYYGTPTPLAQMASVSVPESRMLTIQPWDVSAIKEIEKAIQKSDLGLTPSNDGKIIRINIPA